jgi:EmrB/QacA subfamily drug resistance transporter
MTGFDGFRGRLVERLKERGTHRRWVLITSLVGMFATTFPVTILTVALADIAGEFGVSMAFITWVIAAPMLASAVALPILGKMGDLYGQRKVFLAGFVLATLAAGVTAFAWSAVALIVLRTLTQVIGAATQPTSMALVMRAFPPDERVKALGWWSLVGAGAPAVGLAVGSGLIELVGWRAIFGVQAALAVVPVVVAALILEEHERPAGRARFDLPGAATLALAAGGLMFALTQSAVWGWTSPAVLGSLALAPVATVVFVRVERRSDSPLLPLELLHRRNFVAPNVSSFFGGGAYMGGFVLAPLLLTTVLGWTTAGVALLVILRPLTYSLASPLGGQLGARVGERRGAVVGSSILAVSMALYVVGAAAQTAVVVAVALFVQGLGNGLSRPPLTASLANAVDEADLGLASASQRMLHQIGNAFGISVLTAVYAGVDTPGSFARAYGVAFVLAAVAVVAAAMLHDRPRGAATEEVEEAIELDPTPERTEPVEGRPFRR